MQFLPGSKERGQLTPGGWNGSQTTLQSAYSVQSSEVCGIKPLQQCAALSLWGRKLHRHNPLAIMRPEFLQIGVGGCWKKLGSLHCFLSLFDFLLYVFSQSRHSPCFMFTGFLPELPDSAGQKLPSSGPETGVSAHPVGERQVSQTGKTYSQLMSSFIKSCHVLWEDMHVSKWICGYFSFDQNFKTSNNKYSDPSLYLPELKRDSSQWDRLILESFIHMAYRILKWNFFLFQFAAKARNPPPINSAFESQMGK